MIEPPSLLDDNAFSVQLLQTSGLTCPSCNHNLSGTTDMLCSECGVIIVLRVQLKNVTEVRWYISLLLGLCGLTTISLIMVLVSLAARFRDHFVLWNIMLFAVCCGGLVLWIRHRRRITTGPKRSDRRKWVLLFLLLAAIVVATVAVEQGGLLQ
ncbi:MAG: hypothetical protein P8M32_00460 [Phycisphaerales bacterium]|nr:hypothetical protein [Phycisphaerales bacterium]